MLIQPFLRRFVVIGRDRKNAIRADIRKLPRQRNDLHRVVAASARKNWNSSLRQLDGSFYDPKVLLMRQRGTFSRCPAGNQKIDPRLNLTLNQPVQRPLVQRTIVTERSDQCRSRSRKASVSSHVFPLLGFLIFDRRPVLAAWDAGSENPQLNSPRICRNSKTPCLPATHRAARKAPRAKPSRLRAVCRSVMVSAAESNPISCVPGCAPARFAVRVSVRL